MFSVMTKDKPSPSFHRRILHVLITAQLRGAVIVSLGLYCINKVCCILHNHGVNSISPFFRPSHSTVSCRGLFSFYTEKSSLNLERSRNSYSAEESNWFPNSILWTPESMLWKTVLHKGTLLNAEINLQSYYAWRYLRQRFITYYLCVGDTY